MDQQLYQMNETLTNLAFRMNIVEEITKNWNCMQQELTTIDTEIAAVRESQLALTNLMEGISTRLDIVVETKPPLEEFADAGVEQLARGWELNISGEQSLLMARLSTILEVTGMEEETAYAVTAPMMSVFAPLVSLLEIRPQGTPSVIAPSLALPRSRPAGTPVAPLSMQSGVGNATLKECVE